MTAKPLAKKHVAFGFVAVATLIGAGSVALLTANAGSVSGADIGNIRQVVMDAVSAQNDLSVLPAGVKPGHMSPADRKDLRDRIRAAYGRYYSGAALVRNLNASLVWADRIADNGDAGYAIYSRVSSYTLDDPIIVGNSATITGNYVVEEKQGIDTADGRTSAVGGTYTNSISAQLERVGKEWRITDYSSSALDFAPDPALDNGVDPEPEETKFVPPSYVPLPPDPMNP